jgi:8-oxo-dGTP diphosphatase
MIWIPKRLYRKIIKSIPILCVDLVFKLRNKTLLIKRKIPPCKGYWCLVGGRVFYGEKVIEAVHRQARNETGLKIKVKKFIGVYDDPKRDSSKHSISLAYLVTPIGGKLKIGPEASEIKFFERLPKRIGFDHRKILNDAGFR